MTAASNYKTVILGAGPAGLQMAYDLHQANENYLLLERGPAPGTFFSKFPRHRRLISINKVHTGRSEKEYNLRHDWNSLLTRSDQDFLFKDYSRDYFPAADDLVRYLGDFADKFELNIRFQFDAVRIDRDPQGGGFTLLSSDGAAVECERLIIASGLSRPFVPEIPGIELAEGYETVSVDKEDFAGQNILILGKGNSALELANHLLSHAAVIHLSSPHAIRFAWDTHFVGHVRSVNTMFMDSYLLKSQNGVLDGETKEIRKTDSGKFAVRWSSVHTDIEEEIEQMEYDRVIRCTGFAFDDSLFSDRCKPELTHDGKLPAMTGAWESTNIPELYFAGTLMQTLDFKRSQSSFIHGFRHNVKTLARILIAKDANSTLDSDPVEMLPRELATRILDRANVTCGLWQQVDFLCDVIEFPNQESTTGHWFKDLTYSYVQDYVWGPDEDREYYTFGMTFGPCPAESTVFNHAHVHNPASELVHGDLTTEIHPVIRRMKGNQLMAEYHVRTDFVTDWGSDFYLQPLISFFERDLAGQPQVIPKRPSRRELVRNSEMRFSDVRVDGVSLTATSAAE